MAVRAKFFVSKIAESSYQKGSGEVELRAVYKHGDEDHDNKQFWDATPNGEMKMFLNGRPGEPGEGAFEWFKARFGTGDIYVEFKTAEEMGIPSCTGGYGKLDDETWGDRPHVPDCPYVKH